MFGCWFIFFRMFSLFIKLFLFFFDDDFENINKSFYIIVFWSCGNCVILVGLFLLWCLFFNDFIVIGILWFLFCFIYFFFIILNCLCLSFLLVIIRLYLFNLNGLDNICLYKCSFGFCKFFWKLRKDRVWNFIKMRSILLKYKRFMLKGRMLNVVLIILLKIVVKF